MIAQWAAAQLWNVTSLLVKCTIDLFTWAFSLDLLNGGDGALSPIGDAITDLYENVIGEAWMVAAILIAGIWGIWKALVQRRYTETAGALAVSVLFVLIALFFVYQPERTVGQASAMDQHALARVPLRRQLAARSTTPTAPSARSPITSSRRCVVQPWAVLEFGGLAHCVDTDRLDDDGFPRPGQPARPRARRLPRPPQARQGRPRRLRRRASCAQRPGSEERKAEYDALREGEAPPIDSRSSRGYRVDKADAPAVDAQQAGGAFQRLTFAVIVFVGALGAVVLLGFLSLAVILAQVVALVLLGFAPVALIIGIFPGAGHAFFRAWLSKLATAIFIKALYSLVIAIVVAVSAALTARDRLARLPVRVRAADDLLLGDLHLPQADHQPARLRDHRRRRRRADAAHDRRAEGRRTPRRRPFTALASVSRSRRRAARRARSTADGHELARELTSDDAAAADADPNGTRRPPNGTTTRQRRATGARTATSALAVAAGARSRGATRCGPATLDQRRRAEPAVVTGDPLDAPAHARTDRRADSRRRAGSPEPGAAQRADAALLARGRHAPRPRAARAPARAPTRDDWDRG